MIRQSAGKRQNGFTLVELIISIAILALFSGFILQMFLISSSMDENAVAIDVAGTVSESLMEYIKVQDAPSDVLESALLANYTVIYEQNICRVFQDYTADWQLMPTPEVADASTGARYRMEMTIAMIPEAQNPVLPIAFSAGQSDQTGSGNGEASLIAGQYEITIRVYQLREGQSAAIELTNTVARKYFVFQQ